MAQTAQGISKVVAYKKETEFGVVATGTTGGKTLRRVTASFNLNKDTYQSEEIRQDYQVADMRHGVISIEGSISGELSAGSYSDFLASALSRDFTETVVTATGELVVALADGMYTIKRTTGSFITDGVSVGNVIRLTGMNASNSNKNLLVVQLTPTLATVVVLNGTTLTAETKATGGAVVVVGKTTFAPLEDHTNDSYTFEEFYADIGQSEVTTGNKVNTVGLSLPATGMSGIELGFTGQQMSKTGTTRHFTNALAQGNTGVFSAVNGALIIDGKVASLVTGLNININRNLTSEPVVGSNVVPDIYNGRITVDGDFSTLFQNRQFADAFKNETEISLVVALSENNSADANVVSIVLPRIKLSSDTKDDGEKGIVAQNSFTALLGTGTNGFLPTTIMIQDTSLTA